MSFKHVVVVDESALLVLGLRFGDQPIIIWGEEECGGIRATWEDQRMQRCL